MKKTKHVIVRISEAQLKRLVDTIITEQKTKSTIVRAALDQYMDETSRSSDMQTRKQVKNKKS
jgi:hypothetical protein